MHIDEMSWDGMYGCPVFVTSERGATFVFLANVPGTSGRGGLGWAPF